MNRIWIYIFIVLVASSALAHRSGPQSGQQYTNSGGGGSASLDGCTAVAGDLTCTGDVILSTAGSQFTSVPSLTASDAFTLCERGNNADGGGCEGPLVGAADTNWTTTPTFLLAENGIVTGSYQTAAITGSIDDPASWDTVTDGDEGVEFENTVAIGTCITATGSPANVITISCNGVYRFWFEAWFRFDYTTDTNAAKLGLYWAETDLTTIHPNTNVVTCNGGGSAVTHEQITSFETVYQVTSAPQTFGIYGAKCAGATTFTATTSKTLEGNLTSFGIERIK